jgi:hypothetical protein
LVAWLIDWLTDLLVAWLTDLFVGWLVGWLVDHRHPPTQHFTPTHSPHFRLSPNTKKSCRQLVRAMMMEVTTKM